MVVAADFLAGGDAAGPDEVCRREVVLRQRLRDELAARGALRRRPG